MIKKIRDWSHKVLPSVYDDSLSYYEVLNKVSAKCNEIIDVVNENTEIIEGLDSDVQGAKNAALAAQESAENAEESAANAEESAAQALASARAAEQATESAVSAIDYLAENLQIGYKELSQDEGYITANSNYFRPLGDSGLVIVNGCLILDLTNASTIGTSVTIPANTYTKIADFNSSINSYVPSAFYTKGIGFLNGSMVEIVVSKGQPTSYFNDGIWIRPQNGTAITCTNASIYSSPMVICTIGNAFN